MSDDLISLIIYLALGLVGVIASAYKNKMKKQQSAGRPKPPEVPHSFPANPEKDYGPEFGPLIELFDLPRPKQEQVEYETIENGPSVEEAGMAVDTEEASQEMAGMLVDNDKSDLEKQASEVETFEEGQSDIQKMIAKYEAIRKEMDEAELRMILQGAKLFLLKQRKLPG